MIWLTWRQFRLPAIVALGALGVVAIILSITGPHIADLFHTSVTTCAINCPSARSTFARYDLPLQNGLNALVIFAPALIGLFWGAPLVAREFETGTFRLAWTEGVTRRSWMATKLAGVGVASMLLAGLLSLFVTWWSSLFDRVNLNRLSPGVFAARDIVPIGLCGSCVHTRSHRRTPHPANDPGDGCRARRVFRSAARHDLLAASAPLGTVDPCPQLLDPVPRSQLRKRRLQGPNLAVLVSDERRDSQGGVGGLEPHRECHWPGRQRHWLCLERWRQSPWPQASAPNGGLHSRGQRSGRPSSPRLPHPVPSGARLSTCQSLLDVPMGRVGNIYRSRDRPERLLHLVDQPPTCLKADQKIATTTRRRTAVTNDGTPARIRRIGNSRRVP